MLKHLFFSHNQTTEEVYDDRMEYLREKYGYGSNGKDMGDALPPSAEMDMWGSMAHSIRGSTPAPHSPPSREVW